jgi:3-phenylpropionate/trans-cinnamate dioxygenase ferredoxin subunit
MASHWVEACDADDIDEEDVIRFDHGGRTFALYRSPDDRYFASDGHCTHEQAHLADGLVMGNTIECPKHFSIFDFVSGEVETPPACENLTTYRTRVENGRIHIEI